MDRDRPIIFSAPMVRAILAGRKTQTRRVIKPQPYEVRPPDDGCGWRWEFCRRGLAYAWNTEAERLASGMVGHCPYGHPGDRLWCRERWAPFRGSGIPCEVDRATYACFPDGTQVMRDGRIYPWTLTDQPNWPESMRWRPSIHMPRWASRITLEITGVRVERLQAIGPIDAEAEGFPLGSDHADPVAAFRATWDQINGKTYPWLSNPWVWRIEFRRLTPDSNA